MLYVFSFLCVSSLEADIGADLKGIPVPQNAEDWQVSDKVIHVQLNIYRVFVACTVCVIHLLCVACIGQTRKVPTTQRDQSRHIS